ncbi:hypothetical protein KIW84_023190 [Lathyrus oleraceus]|uniref:DUF7745 domain-containing protein n=1 Tax=Pisum sativum TaxID=3888 RepID=A0A9D4YCC1_PEA|nr:hypothetical protein KIW84_023190 [Pisum sativum]
MVKDKGLDAFRLGHYNKHNGGPAKSNQTITVNLKSSGYNFQHNHNHSVFIQSSVDNDAITFFRRVDEFSKLLFLYRQIARHNSAFASKSLHANSFHVHHLQDKDFGAKAGQSNSFDGHASEHLLSLLRKGPLHKDFELSSVTDTVDNTERETTGKFLDNPEKVNADCFKDTDMQICPVNPNFSVANNVHADVTGGIFEHAVAKHKKFVMGSERRKALPFKAKMPDIANISRLLNELPACFRVTLQGKFGHILDLLSLDVQTPAITALAQFYNPPLRSFLFQDFQLTPTLEEFDRLLGFSMKGRTPYNRIGQVPEVEMLALALCIPISDALANWKKRENLFGFWRAYLEEEAERLFVIHHWDSLANILALLIYGLIIRSWEKVHTKGTELVKKNDAARVPYQQWISERIKVVKLPFSIEIPLRSTSPEPVPVSLEEVEELRAMVAKLGKEKDDLQSELYKETGKNMILKRKSNQRKELLEESRKKNRIEQDLKERVLECLDQADSGLGSLCDELAKAKRDGQEWKRWWDLATKQKKEQQFQDRKIPSHVPHPSEDSEQLHGAFQGWGTNEGLIISILTHRNASQRKAIRETYAQTHGEDLLKDLDKELSSDFEKVVLLWTLDPAEHDAFLANQVTKMLTSNNVIIMEIASTRSPLELLKEKHATILNQP